jgi:hypothetical protein
MTGLKVVSFDVGMINIGIWAGEFIPNNKEFPFRFRHWEVLNLGTTNLKAACEQMVEEFERRPFLNEKFDYVIIENQIDDNPAAIRGKGRRSGFSNAYKIGRMKSMGTAIHTYFYTRRCIIAGPDCEKISYVSARNKLSVYQGPPIKPKGRSRYAKNKSLAELHTKAMLESALECGECDRKWLTWFSGLKKKDDAADAFLQAAYWMMKKAKWGVIGDPKIRRQAKKQKAELDAQLEILSEDDSERAESLWG